MTRTDKIIYSAFFIFIALLLVGIFVEESRLYINDGIALGIGCFAWIIAIKNLFSSKKETIKISNTPWWQIVFFLFAAISLAISGFYALLNPWKIFKDIYITPAHISIHGIFGLVFCTGFEVALFSLLAPSLAGKLKSKKPAK